MNSYQQNNYDVNQIGLFEVYKRDLKIRHYSPKTIKTYTSLLRRFARHFHPIHPREITSEQIKEYLYLLIEKGKCSSALLDQTLNALRFLYVELYHLEFILTEISRPRSERKIPQVLCKEDILRIFQTITNSTHRLILQLIWPPVIRCAIALPHTFLRPEQISAIFKTC